MSPACLIGGMLGLLVADAVLTDGGVEHSFFVVPARLKTIEDCERNLTLFQREGK